MIEIKHVSKHFTTKGKVLTALREVSLHIHRGEIYALIGESGAGKSTLLHCMNLLERPSEGEVWVDGVNMTKLSPSALQEKRQQISMIFQHFNLVSNLSVFNNVALPLKLHGKKINPDNIFTLLDLVDIKDKAQDFPNNLSGGQKQRVAIARALVTEPTLLLCDEATSSLDPQTTQGVLSLLKKINQQMNITIVLITHQIEVVKSLCDRFAIIKEGAIEDVSQVNEVFNFPSAARSLLLESLKPKFPDYLKDKLCTEKKADNYPICQILFFGKLSQTPIISELSNNIGIKINILQANVDSVSNHPFGILVVQLMGDEKQIKQSLDYLNAQRLEVEILGYV